MAETTRRRTEPVTVHLNEDALASLDALAKREKVDRAVLARHLLSEAMQARARQGRA